MPALLKKVDNAKLFTFTVKLNPAHTVKYEMGIAWFLLSALVLQAILKSFSQTYFLTKPLLRLRTKIIGVLILFFINKSLAH